MMLQHYDNTPMHYMAIHIAVNMTISVDFFLLTHLSRRLIGELMVYPWSGVRLSSDHKFKHLLLQIRLANQGQILCRASLGRGRKFVCHISVT